MLMKANLWCKTKSKTFGYKSQGTVHIELALEVEAIARPAGINIIVYEGKYTLNSIRRTMK